MGKKRFSSVHVLVTLARGTFFHHLVNVAIYVCQEQGSFGSEFTLLSTLVAVV